ncbi:acyltransferase domain-containing protein, partial [Streptomyces sp. NPDC048279]|uniref:acyltransferase domain-containing protein n=1 Tax=Streptomyces sp. NPDC048279 TaxID=3154714 RepID=UPI003434E2A8
VLPWVLSARTSAALSGQAERLLAHLERHPDLDPVDIAFSLATARARLEHRAVLIGVGREDFLAGLKAVAADGTAQKSPRLLTGVSAGSLGGPVFVFPGQGSQWSGMAARLLAESPVFRAGILECEEAFAPYVDWSLTDVLREAPGAPSTDRVDVVQPVLFAVMVSLAELWRSYGVEPAAVVGHSQGEIAAACVAGALSLEDAAMVVALRSKALTDLSGAGGMMSVQLPVDEVTARLSAFGDRLAVAAVNGPHATVVAGEPAALEEFHALCRAENVRARRIPVDYASHSLQVEAIRGELTQVLATAAPRTPEVPFHSTVDGETALNPVTDAGYWYRNLRRTVRFERTIRSLLASGHRHFIEVSPHPVLIPGLQETIEDATPGAHHSPEAVETLRRGDGGLDRFLASAARLHVLGVDVDWAAAVAGRRPRRVPLPSYAFQRQRFWLAADPAPGNVLLSGLTPVRHPMLASLVSVPGTGGLLFTGRLSPAAQPWLAGHTVHGVAVLPNSALVELALCAGGHVGLHRIAELTVETPLVLPERNGADVQLLLEEADGSGSRPFTVFSRVPGEETTAAPPTRHASGVLATAKAPAAPSRELEVWPPQGSSALPVDDLYTGLEARGLDCGPSFRCVRGAWQRGNELFVEAALPDDDQDVGGFGLHPVLLDAALHPLLAGVADNSAELRLPTVWRGASLSATDASVLRVRIVETRPGTVALTAADTSGGLVASVDSLVLKPVEPARYDVGLRPPKDRTEVRWVPLPVAGAPDDSLTWAIIGTPDASPDSESRSAHHHSSLADLTAAREAGIPLPTMVLVPLSEGLSADPGEDTARVAADAVAATRSLLREWVEDERFTGQHLVLATRTAQSLPGDAAPDTAAAAVSGLVRATQTCYPGRIT